MNVKLVEITPNLLPDYHQSNAISDVIFVDPTFPNAKLREYPTFKKYPEYLATDDDFVAFLSPKFVSKCAISHDDFKEWVERNDNIGIDVFFINPTPINETLFLNTVQHGNNCHKGLEGLLQRHLPNCPNINNLLMDGSTFAMCNYFCGNRKFWDAYTSFADEYIKSVEKNPEDAKMLYETSASYGRDKSLPYYPFAIERLFSIFLCFNRDISSASYKYSIEQLAKKTRLDDHILSKIITLREIKKEFPKDWIQLRNEIASKYPFLFTLE